MIGTSAGSARAGLVYAIGDGGSSLLRFDTSNPGSITRVGSFGGADSFLDAIDFRPATGQLFGYRDATDSYFTVDLATGNLTLASAANVGAQTNTFFLGMDFNPTIDRLRVVTESTQNIVFNPLTGTATSFTPLFYAAGDPNAGLVPLVIDNAYTNNRPGAVTTTQYVLDAGLGVLARLDNNNGTLTTIGQIQVGGAPLNFNDYAGFDIFTTAGGIDIAYALLTVGGSPGLYTIDLTTGAATSVGTLGTGFGDVYSLAVVPIPEPSACLAMGIGTTLLGLAALRRRSKTLTHS